MSILAMKRKEIPTLLDRIQAELAANLADEDYDITALCKALHLSRMHLHRKLKALTGKSTSAFINTYKLNAAQALLKDSDLAVSEIAYRVGYKTPSYFTQMFVKEFGLSPSEFRKQG
ncbi:MAG: helix-turn-helix transcriptional regulator [Bacteroidota bacterium]